ncbi:MAG TPA: hypothetical protein GXX26_05515 [Clostridiaceae bacterium]|jgi:hypothetical protein|nr:hypothetical protein [Clostridiaceae bacterium]
MVIRNALETAGQEDSDTGSTKSARTRAFLVDEEREVIEVFGGNPPVCHHRQAYTNTVGNDRNKIMPRGLMHFSIFSP